MITRRRLLTLCQELLSLPTTSFHEHHVLRALTAHADGLGLPAAQDRWGNLHVRLQQGTRRQRTWILIAHCDHPGFAITSVRGRRARGRWFGRVEPRYFQGTPVLIHPERGPTIGGRIRRITCGGPQGRVLWVDVDTETPVTVGDIGTWDLAGFRRRGDRIATRSADDLIGCTLLAALLESLARSDACASLEVIYTRAEEAGLLGSTALARAQACSHAHPILVLEASRALPHVRIGAGPVLRVGDRMSAFDPGLAHLLQSVAAELSRTRPGFRSQRALMDGGVCEATSFGAFGYRATGLAIPLGNYHNMGRTRIAAEEVSLDDLGNALALLVALVTRPWRGPAWPPVVATQGLLMSLRAQETILRRSVSRPVHAWSRP